MRSPALIATAGALLASLTIAPHASGTALPGPTPDARTTTVRAACSGGGRIAMTASQPGDGSVTIDAVASQLPLDTVLDGSVTVVSAAGGGGGGFGGVRPDPDGTFHDSTTVPLATDPIVRLNYHSQDGQLVCIVRVDPERQWARSTCRLSERLVSVTAVQNGAMLDVASKLDAVPPRSAWNASGSVTSPNANEGGTKSTHASAAGIVRSAFSFGYSADRVVTVAFANPDGKGCRISIATNALTTV